MMAKNTTQKTNDLAARDHMTTGEGHNCCRKTYCVMNFYILEILNVFSRRLSFGYHLKVFKTYIENLSLKVP